MTTGTAECAERLNDFDVHQPDIGDEQISNDGGHTVPPSQLCEDKAAKEGADVDPPHDYVDEEALAKNRLVWPQTVLVSIVPAECADRLKLNSGSIFSSHKR